MRKCKIFSSYSVLLSFVSVWCHTTNDDDDDLTREWVEKASMTTSSFIFPFLSVANIIFACYFTFVVVGYSIIQTFFVNAKSHIVLDASLFPLFNSTFHFRLTFVHSLKLYSLCPVYGFFVEARAEHCLWIIVSLINFFIEFPSCASARNTHEIIKNTA